ncbi:HAD family hydrolase [Kitasatospora sp. NE20-6]|uniref:HAD family hydrolase n=1 Tax=Kitasatospora sp. NE20-6 TaxID=2859066 RepID=UPI0038B36242
MSGDGDRALVLDLDGTVYPADGPVTAAIDARTTDFLLRHTGLGAGELAALERERPSILDALDHLGIPRDHWARAVHGGLEYTGLLRPDPGLRAALARVRARRVVVTLAPATHARSVLAALGLTDLVDDLFSVFDTADAYKDRVYAELAADQGGGARILVVGDNPRLDLDPAAAHGCGCLLVGRPRGPQRYPAYATLPDALTSAGFAAWSGH